MVNSTFNIISVVIILIQDVVNVYGIHSIRVNFAA